jgi:hypothetical protein
MSDRGTSEVYRMMTDTAGGDQGEIPVGQSSFPDMPSNYRIELSSDMLDEQGNVLDYVICFAFNTLYVRVLDIRVVQAKDWQTHASPAPRNRRKDDTEGHKQ